MDVNAACVLILFAASDHQVPAAVMNHIIVSEPLAVFITFTNMISLIVVLVTNGFFQRDFLFSVENCYCAARRPYILMFCTLFCFFLFFQHLISDSLSNPY